MQDLHSCAAWIESQALRDQVMRIVEVMLVPLAKMFFRFPVGEQPEFLGLFRGTKDVETNKSGSVFNQVRAVDKGTPHLGLQPIGDGETA